ncbi:MAG: hypothetical protein CMJ31_12940 [Phycisphaerae bacterium]|nr:hypothetical protein [Phycisphaerae bacterium]
MKAMSDPGDDLQHRAERAKAAAEALRAAKTFAELEAEVAQAEPPRNFFRAVTRHGTPDHTSVIAEITRRSSTGQPLEPATATPASELAAAFQRAGAVALSCATNPEFSGGSLDDIAACRAASDLPVLRRDCLVDTWQLWESRAAGADAVSLIAEILTESQLIDMLILAQQLGMTVLIEVHSMDQLLRVRPHVGFPHPTYCLLGINNRDPNTPHFDVNQTMRLVDLVDDTNVLVSLGGVQTPDDLRKLRGVSVRAILLGETLLAQPDPPAALANLLDQRST